jgi:hypothetical protein
MSYQPSSAWIKAVAGQPARLDHFRADLELVNEDPRGLVLIGHDHGTRHLLAAGIEGDDLQGVGARGKAIGEVPGIV